ncbi:ATP-binding protein [Shewanella intestini]|uniref:histidine kinase n=1 Tax=Shewanella intestini TaxID=2017544 RepID=A0ABS5HZG3_9GAMM|nr:MULTISPECIES: ATP-binding protein [Shewanella]MBR9727174.1 two-component sensor histidine kinase [Shewanella intestini]MRG35976.1 two-component sensor histidine kinase [Shewanella sp. XMDDZSB0408]
MKKLIISLVLVVIIAIASLGWTITQIAAVTESTDGQANTIEKINALKWVGESLAKTLNDPLIDQQQFIRHWNSINDEKMSIIAESAFALPPSLHKQFIQQAALVLDSDEGISLHYHLDKTQQVLNISTTLVTPDEQLQSSNEHYTMLFYGGVSLILLLWISPLIRQLINLSKTTKAFGMGQLQQRIKIKNTSYISEIEIEFNRMADRIQQLVDDNKLLSRAVSHDLKTPIARLRFGIEALEETSNPALKVKYFARLNTNLDTMEELVATLLSYARLDEANISPALSVFDLNQWLIERYANQHFEQHTFTLLSASQPILIQSDRQYLAMQVSNLLSNAERFGQQHIQISIVVNPDTVQIRVEDDGKGIDDNEALEVIKPFVRGQHSRDNAGHGMGLAIVARIGNWMDSKLTIDRSAQLGGACMILTLVRINEHE